MDRKQVAGGLGLTALAALIWLFYDSKTAVPLALILLLFAALLLFWPGRGLAARRKTAVQTRQEDALKHILACEMEGRHPDVASIAGTLHISRSEAANLLADMQTAELLTIEAGGIHLRPAGRATALHIVRAHRLWERFLADETGFSELDWHEQAERIEHTLSTEAANALEAQLNFPTHDPHGDPIPTVKGDLFSHQGLPLTSLSPDTRARIIHLEDEPKAVYAQLVAQGITPGMVISRLRSKPDQIHFRANGTEHHLSPIVATNITVEPLPDIEDDDSFCAERLASLKTGETAEVLRLSPACRGIERRRLMDLGILPGTKITNEMRSPSGDPTAYRIRGAVIALRHEQANYIYVRRNDVGE